MVLNNDIPSTIPNIPRFAGNSPNLPIIPIIMKIKRGLVMLVLKLLSMTVH